MIRDAVNRDIQERPLFIFEMANNHMGRLEHGLRIIASLREVTRDFPFQFAVKLQYRDIDSFIHPAYRTRYDLKFVKRFSETRLPWCPVPALQHRFGARRLNCRFGRCGGWDH